MTFAFQTSVELRRRKGSESESPWSVVTSATFDDFDKEVKVGVTGRLTDQPSSSVARDRTREFDAIVTAFRSIPKSNQLKWERINHISSRPNKLSLFLFAVLLLGIGEVTRNLQDNQCSS